jgi:16S rRNA (cytosine967-C5)-methyltransferase
MPYSKFNQSKMATVAPDSVWGKPKERQAAVARVVALEMLRRIGGPSGQGMERTLEEARKDGRLSARDGALAQEIARGVCRRRRWLEQLLDRFLHKPLPLQAYSIRDGLLIGLYQAIYLDKIPPHTLVDETVRLVGGARTESGFRSLANAVMRKVVSTPREELLPKDSDPWLVTESVPEWLASEAEKIFPDAGSQKFFTASNEHASLNLRAVSIPGAPDLEVLIETLRGEIIDLTGSAPEIERGRFSPDCLIVHGRGIAPMDLPSFRSGFLTAEDEGAQVVGWLSGARPGMRILDLCASPGGKTVHLADMCNRQFERLVAADMNEEKLSRLGETLRRTGLSESVETKLFSEVITDPELEGYFDLVFVDAPCSSLGTLRRHPEVRWRMEPTEIRTLSRTQRRILKRASKLVKPGGTLFYSVCTFTQMETDTVIDRFLINSEGEFSLYNSPVESPFDASSLACGEGKWRTETHLHQCDTFFASRLIRRG